jgi:pimeloyl-ACP methyl ester carboxylesterase
MRTIGRLFLVIIVLAAIGAVVVYRAPIWTQLQITHTQLLFSRVQSNYVMTPEGRVHYYEAEPRIPGGGVPLVLVHGLGDRSEAWAPMLRRLKRAGFHVYAPDLLGYGRSPKPEESDYSIETQEKFVLDFIKSLGLQKTDIGGWSMGGWVTLKVALDHPEMIDRVVVYDSAGITFPVEDKQMFHPNTMPDVEKLMGRMEPNAKLPPNVLRDLMKSLQEQQWVIDRGMKSMLSGDALLDKTLPNLQEPLLIMWGKDDQLIPASTGEAMHALLPSSELDVVEGCGHLMPNLCAYRAAAATSDFLKANPVPTGGVRTLTKMR